MVDSYIEGLGSKMALDKQTIAKRYGKALFETAKEQDVLTETSSELAQIKQVL